MEAARMSETSVNLYQTVRRNIPEQSSSIKVTVERGEKDAERLYWSNNEEI
jgi:3-deoxy-D-manno-octulosonic-acid transferase